MVRWQWHSVHTLGRGRWRRRRLCDGRVCVHGRERRLAESWLWNPATRSPVSRSHTKSVLLQWNMKNLGRSTIHLFSCFCENAHNCLPLSCSLPQAINHFSHMRWCVPPHGWNLDMAVTTLSLWCRNLLSKSQESTAGRKVGIPKVWFKLVVTCLISVMFLSRWQWYLDWKLEK